ncbi:nicotinate-nicotinamide nucleotide adenylyltransferase [Pontibacillus sp. ALD_SL1]|uniref:nicotinate-nicotinamide nucleotide adenylyltransferase n=1 Tax=Pontibacillus sp. ALD_SL1 TaxID=2777185 RepID=UPI001F617E07|nr:hypothetical protein [Pontibacillus sp. ALD_SL1]
MIEMAIEDNPLFEVDDYEMKQEAWSIYTYYTMKHFKEKYPHDEIRFMMGADLLGDIGKGEWKYGDELVAEKRESSGQK